MKENGIKVSIATLKRWKDENGLTHKRKKISYQTINIKEKKRNIYTCNDTFSNDVITKDNNTIKANTIMKPETIEIEVKPTNIERKKKPYITPTIEVRENKHIIAV